MQKSETIKELATALSKAQGSFKPAAKTAKNPHFGNMFAPLESIIESVRDPLAKNGLSFMQITEFENGITTLRTTVLHSSGEWISSSYEIKPERATPQGMGSAMTYARRYTLSALLGLATEEDDDGNAASLPKETSSFAKKEEHRAAEVGNSFRPSKSKL
jgi:hypothetical protein